MTVLSPVTLGASSALGVFAGSFTVMGPLTVGPGGAFGDVPPFVGAAPIVINGPVKVQKNGYFGIGVEAPSQPLISAIRGPVTATNASSVQIHNTLVAGPVRLLGGGNLNAIAEFFFPSGNNFNGPRRRPSSRTCAARSRSRRRNWLVWEGSSRISFSSLASTRACRSRASR
ncbi:MAG: hypothetical protein M3T56_16875 [Chloroflexota bacterium]|nr:hypothetical protein [Chloroflexota bacterium]